MRSAVFLVAVLLGTATPTPAETLRGGDLPPYYGEPALPFERVTPNLPRLLERYDGSAIDTETNLIKDKTIYDAPPSNTDLEQLISLYPHPYSNETLERNFMQFKLSDAHEALLTILWHQRFVTAPDIQFVIAKLGGNTESITPQAEDAEFANKDMSKKSSSFKRKLSTISLDQDAILHKIVQDSFKRFKTNYQGYVICTSKVEELKKLIASNFNGKSGTNTAATKVVSDQIAEARKAYKSFIEANLGPRALLCIDRQIDFEKDQSHLKERPSTNSKLTIVLTEPLNHRIIREAQAFRAKTTSDLKVVDLEGRVISIPAGAEVKGRIAMQVPYRNVALIFDSIAMQSEKIRLGDANLVSQGGIVEVQRGRRKFPIHCRISPGLPVGDKVSISAVAAPLSSTDVYKNLFRSYVIFVNPHLRCGDKMDISVEYFYPDSLFQSRLP